MLSRKEWERQVSAQMAAVDGYVAHVCYSGWREEPPFWDRLRVVGVLTTIVETYWKAVELGEEWEPYDPPTSRSLRTEGFQFSHRRTQMQFVFFEPESNGVLTEADLKEMTDCIVLVRAVEDTIPSSLRKDIENNLAAMIAQREAAAAKKHGKESAT